MYALQLTESRCPPQTDNSLQSTTVGDVLQTAAVKSPDTCALQEVDEDGVLQRRWTYAALLADAVRLAGALLTRYRPGERIAVWAPNVPEWIIMEFAVGMAGLVLVTVNPGFQARELKYVLEQSNAVGLFLIKAHRGTSLETIAAAVTKDIPAIREVVNLFDFPALYAEAGPLRPLPDVRASDAAQIQYTSGSTGFPKGVMLHHQGITNNARFYFARSGARAGAKALVYLPLYHSGGCVGAVLGPVQYGCRLILACRFDAERMNAIIESEAVSLMISVPTMLIAMLEADRAHPRDLSSVRTVGVGGSPVSPELVRRVRDRLGCDFGTVYGQTETSPLLAMTWPTDSFDDICNTVGQPLPQTEIAILDPDDYHLMPTDMVGEICARGYGLMLGYNNDPMATQKTIDADGWLHTGDLGQMDARGFVKVTGRVKDMIIRGGENIFPAEIENILLEHDTVAEAAVVGVTDEWFGEAVAAFIRVFPGMTFNPIELTAHCRANLAAQKTPAHWVEVHEWPLTGSGKIQKYVLRDRFAAGLFADIPAADTCL